jgi:hypothetical protein
MRNLTEDEIRDYLAYVQCTPNCAEINMEQCEMIGMAAMEFGLMEVFGKKALLAKADGLEATEVMLSFWIWAFQMGRECESRLLTLALQKGRR